MTKSVPTFAVFHHRFFLGYVSAVCYRDACKRAARRFPGKRLEVELTTDRNTRPADRLQANETYQAKRA